MALATKYILLTSGTSWTVPGDWNSTGNNTIHLIGGGGGGTNLAGGGGGGYTKISNFSTTAGSSISYVIGTGGTAAVGRNLGNGGATTFNSGAYSAGGGLCPDGGGSGASGGTGSTYNGGFGAGVGGGGAAGPYGNGIGANGTNIGTPGPTGGSNGDAGFGGTAQNTGNGRPGTEIWPGVAGSGSGGIASTSSGGLYGGGGGPSGAGAQGAIIIEYIGKVGSGFEKSDDVFGTIDLDDQYVTDSWLVDKYVGGVLFAFGSNGAGQLGNGGSGGNYSSPQQIGSLTNWKQVSVDAYSLAVKNDGTAWGWGANSSGQVGDGTVTNRSSPVQIGALTTWKYIWAGGLGASYAIKYDGTLWGWGYNVRGQLGLGITTPQYYSNPVQIGALNTWKSIQSKTAATPFSTVLGLTNDGKLYSWGSNLYGSMGINTVSTLYYSNPIQVGALTTWKSIGAGATEMAAIKTDGTLWMWGNNNFGQLGQGFRSASIYYSSPIQVGVLTNWKQVSVGVQYVLAIKTDGTLWAWGNNTNGALGLGDTTNRSSPVQIGTLTNWKQVSASIGTGTSLNNIAVKTDGTLWTWGDNTNGQLGVGNTSYYSSPIQVGSLTNWKYAVAGYYYGLALTYQDLN